MEKNTVLIDLDSYDNLMKQLRDSTEEVKRLNKKMNNKILISKDDFYIKEDDDIRLTIKTDVLKKLVDSIEGYAVKEPYYNETFISQYNLKISKEDI